LIDLLAAAHLVFRGHWQPASREGAAQAALSAVVRTLPEERDIDAAWEAPGGTPDG